MGTGTGTTGMGMDASPKHASHLGHSPVRHGFCLPSQIRPISESSQSQSQPSSHSFVSPSSISQGHPTNADTLLLQREACCGLSHDALSSQCYPGSAARAISRRPHLGPPPAKPAKAPLVPRLSSLAISLCPPAVSNASRSG
ncbi:hypothetical protein CDD83_8740 [Cordyceps sp. RAO-2017]|nr:hypothetical protein CDD83_8740 [Cordyceps sp. RAO-2017]